jgi:hypothetical protein
VPQPGQFFTVRTNPVNHAGLCVGDGQVIEGQPAGAALFPDDHYPNAVWSTIPLTLEQGSRIAAIGRSKVGTPYNWVDVIGIGLTRLFGARVPKFIRDRVGNPKSLFCSQLVDECYLEGDYPLFTDGRVPGSVSPDDLYRLSGVPV